MHHNTDCYLEPTIKISHFKWRRVNVLKLRYHSHHSKSNSQSKRCTIIKNKENNLQKPTDFEHDDLDLQMVSVELVVMKPKIESIVVRKIIEK